MNGKCRKTGMKSARAEIAHLRRDFFARFLATMKMPAGGNLRPPMVCWLEPCGRMNHLCLHAYMQPHAGMNDRPLIPRLYINHFALDDSERIARRMGWELRRRAPVRERCRWSFELSLLPKELPDFAGWIGSLAEAHAANDSSIVVEPPHKCHFWNDRMLDCRYAWSAAAWRRMKAYQERHKKCAA